MDVSLIEMVVSALSAGMRRPALALATASGLLGFVAVAGLAFQLVHGIRLDLPTIVAAVVAGMLAIVAAVFVVGAAIRGAVEGIAALLRLMRRR